MAAPAAAHPSDKTLQSYGLGKLDDMLAEAVGKHLAECDSCRRQVAEVTSDSFLGRLRDAQARPESIPPVGSSLAGLSKLGRESRMPSPPPASTLPPGLADHPDYEILRELGRGGMGVVYLAENRMMGRKEVLKVVSSHLLNRKGVLERFLGEIRNAAKLHHPNIVTAYAALRMGESLVLTMEYVDGLDLAKLVKSRGPLPVANACYYVHQAALGLQHAHEHGMVHRDIKPGNLMRALQGNRVLVKVLDFGLAKVSREVPADGTLTYEGQMLGTPDFIAPEQSIDARKADIRADIYSLGCTLYCLLTGGPPFQGTSLYDILQAHHSRDALPLNLARPEVPVELAALVGKMMAKEPERRFQTPAEVSKALTPFFKPGANPGSGPSPEVSRVGQAAPSPQPLGGGSAPAQPATPATVPVLAPRGPSKPNPEGVAWESLIEIKESEHSTAEVKPKPEVAPTPAPPRRPPWLWASIATGVLLIGLVVASVVIFRTRNGTIVFENLPEQSVVTADGDTFTVEWPDGKVKGHAQITIPPGKHLVQVKVNGVQVTGEEVIVESGGVTPFVVRIGPPPDGTRPRPFDPKQFTIDKGRWIVQGDELMQTEARIHWPCLMFGDDQWTDYDFTVDLMRLHGIEAAFLVVRGADKDNNLVFTNSGWGGTRSLIEVIEKGNFRPLRDVGCRFENLKWYTARVRIRGSEVVGTLLDGAKEIARVELVVNNLRPRGRVGLRTWWSAYRFKNIRVTAPDGRTLWEGPPAIESPRPVGPGAPENPYRESWVSLFSGKDLSGWTAFRGDDEIAPEEIFFVDRNELACFPGNWGRLATRAAYSNFILSLGYHIGPGEDSGLDFHIAPAQGVDRWVFQCQIYGEQPNDAYGCGNIFSDKGLLSRPQAPSKDGRFFGRTRRADLNESGWNTYEIRNEGQKFTVRLNGVVVNEVSSTWEGPWRVSLLAKARGSARFRNIAIKGLDGKPPTIVAPPAPVVADERPVPPVMDLALKKKYCDLIDVNSEYKFQLDQLRNGSLQYAEYNWRFYESKSRFFATDAFGRNDVLFTHPFGGDRPATIDFTRITKDRAGELVLAVHSFPDAANDGSRIVVKVNNKEVHRSRIRFADGWKAIAVPFNRSTVVVEHFPIGWNWEYAFIDFVIKEQSDQRADDKPDRDGLNPARGSGVSPDRAAESPTEVPAGKPPVAPAAKAVEPGKPIPPGPFRVATNGLAGRQFIDPISFGPDWLGFNEPGTAVPWATRDAFARLTTKAALGYPRLPVSRYVCEVELTVHKHGRMVFVFGDPWKACALNLVWNPKREMTECSVSERNHDGGWFWGGSRDFAPERRISLKLVLGDGVQTLIHEDKPISWAQCWPTDCCLRIWSETADSAVIHRCSLRALTDKDVADCGWTTPPTELPFKAGDAAARLAEISEGYPDRPKPRERFAVKTTGTPMAWIPPGEFVMGNRNAKDPAFDRRHRVRLTRGYWMAQVEVTQGEYSKVTGANPSRVTGSPYLPVDWVAWDQAAAYCRKLTNLEHKMRRLPPGYAYRLPTEAEWEYACRAGSDEDFSVPESLVWSRGPSGSRPHEVAESQPNKWGLYDMHGNAMEWCFDAWYDYPKGAKEVTVDPFNIGQPNKDMFVVRGGAWWSGPQMCASHWRWRNRNNPNGFRGFRIVLGPAINSPEQ